MISTDVSYIFDGLQFEEITDRTVGHYIFHIFITFDIVGLIVFEEETNQVALL